MIHDSLHKNTINEKGEFENSLLIDKVHNCQKVTL